MLLDFVPNQVERRFADLAEDVHQSLPMKTILCDQSVGAVKSIDQIYEMLLVCCGGSRSERGDGGSVVAAIDERVFPAQKNCDFKLSQFA